MKSSVINRSGILLVCLLLSSINIAISQTAQDDAGSGIDAPDICEEDWLESTNRIEIEVGVEYDGNILHSQNDQYDSYILIPEESGHASLQLSNYELINSQNLDLKIFRSFDYNLCVGNPSIFWDYEFMGVPGSPEVDFPIDLQFQETEIFIIRVGWLGLEDLNYRFHVNLDTSYNLDQDDLGAEIDAVNCVSWEPIGFIKASHSITLAQSSSRMLYGEAGNGLVDEQGWGDTSDCYQIITKVMGNISISETTKSIENSINIGLDYDIKFEIIDRSTSDLYQLDRNFAVNFVTPRTYIIIIYGFDVWKRNYEYQINFVSNDSAFIQEAIVSSIELPISPTLRNFVFSVVLILAIGSAWFSLKKFKKKYENQTERTRL